MRPVLHEKLSLLALCAALACWPAIGLHANDLGDAVAPQAAIAAPGPEPIVRASLLAEPSAATPGVPFTVALRLRVPDGWHLSWQNPGDAGLPPAIHWKLPAQVAAGALQWPAPHRSQLGPVVTYALDGEVWLLVELVPARALPLSPPLHLAATAEWLVCKELCIPESAQLELLLPLAEKPAPPGLDEPGFLAARARLPRSLGWTAALGAQDVKAGTAELFISMDGQALPLPGARIELFPTQPGAIEPSAPQELELRPGGLSLKLRLPRAAKIPLDELSFVLVMQGIDERDRVAVELSTAPARTAGSGPLPLWLALICAFAGGILLNLMPCVLPVLGFKVLSLVRDASRGARRARVGGLAYSAGVIASFWALAAVLLALRASGQRLGWGFQLQSPAVVSLLALLFFGLGLSFLGFFEMGLSIQSRAGAVRFSEGGFGAFGSGVLATAVATPCTAPFMGVALGAALISSPLAAFSIFTALGVGMAWPYALLSLWPAMLDKVPKPGPWMQRLRQALAFPLFATVLWLLAVLSALAGPQRITATLAAMLLLGFALWLWRSGGGLEAPALQRRVLGLSALALVGLGAWGAAAPDALIGERGEDGLHPNLSAAASHPPGADAEVAWVDWSPERFAQLRAEKRTVFVDFTAAWCISCQINERVVFSSPAVRARFAALGVVPLRADWTRADPAIARALESFGRSGVPLNVVTGPRTSSPLLLPAVLTPGVVLDALEQAR